MRIVQLSQQDDEGGAFKAAYRLHCALNDAGHESHMVVLSKLTNDPRVHPLFRPNILGKVAWRLLTIVNNKPTKKYPKFPRCGWSASNLAINPLRLIKKLRPDMVHLHLFDGILSHKAVASLPYPVCWTLHDMSAITGGCHCTPDCLRYLERCGHCPELGSDHEDDASRKGWHLRHTAWQHPNLTAITPSRWLERETKNSPMAAGKTVVHIPNGIPLDVFTPELRNPTRQQLNFNDDKFYLLAGSAALDNELKGFNLVAETVKQLAASHPGKFELVTFGRGVPDLPGVTLHHKGYIANDAEVAKLYAACDAYILPTLVDNFPNMLLESIACGTPAITFNVGGCPDIIRDDTTGYVVKQRNATSLAQAIIQLAQQTPTAYAELRQNCRTTAESEYSMERMAQAYIELYKRHLSARKPN